MYNTSSLVWALRIHPLTVMEVETRPRHMILLDELLFIECRTITLSNNLVICFHKSIRIKSYHGDLKRTWQSWDLWNALPVVGYWNIHGGWRVRADSVGFSPWAYHPFPGAQDAAVTDTDQPPVYILPLLTLLAENVCLVSMKCFVCVALTFVYVVCNAVTFQR